MDLTIFTALFEQLFHNPACALLVLPISIVAYLLEVYPKFPSRLVAPVCVATGGTMYPLLVRTGTVPPEFPHPLFVLVLNGLILGFVAMLIHALVIKWLINRFMPGQAPPGTTPDAGKPNNKDN